MPGREHSSGQFVQRGQEERACSYRRVQHSEVQIIRRVRYAESIQRGAHDMSDNGLWRVKEPLIALTCSAGTERRL